MQSYYTPGYSGLFHMRVSFLFCLVKQVHLEMCTVSHRLKYFASGIAFIGEHRTKKTLSYMILDFSSTTSFRQSNRITEGIGRWYGHLWLFTWFWSWHWMDTGWGEDRRKWIYQISNKERWNRVTRLRRCDHWLRWSLWSHSDKFKWKHQLYGRTCYSWYVHEI